MSEKIVNIKELHEFKDNPYQVKDNEDMKDLIESIKEYGVIEPLIVRNREKGGYEIVSGHRRKYACEKAGKIEIPVLVRDMDKDMAIITLVDSNLQRSDILPSEKAFAYKMKLEAEKSQSKKSYGHNVHKSRDKIADGISGRQVQRYVRLTELIKPLLQLVDENKMAMNPAVEISYLKEQEQKDLLETIESEDCTPSYSQAIRMKELSKQNKLDMDAIFNIMIEQKPNQKEQIRFKVEKLKSYFPKGYSTKQMEDVIEKLLKQYKQKWKNKDLER
ncbi:MAG: ParB/RepB/Spo0J family partition protein [Clostridia bacterium]|jgi:ParB family chromosome partitioning protein|nr:ParB/RepB/Spo0J family partition protein [Clostridia bacterium]